MRTVIVGSAVEGAVVIAVEVPATHVIDIAVAIIIEPIYWIIRIAPDVGREIWMSVLNALINDPDVNCV